MSGWRPLVARIHVWLGLDRHELLLILMPVLVMLGTVFGVMQLVEGRYRQTVGDALSTALGLSREAIRVWHLDHQQIVGTLAEDADVVAAAVALLPVAPRQNELLAAPAGRALQARMESHLKEGHWRGYALLDRANRTLASSRDAEVGRDGVLRAQPDVLARLWAGQTHISRVIRSGVPEARRADLSLFVGAPVRKPGGEVIAVLVLQIDPGRSLFPILLQGRLGQTGEGYLFDRSGWMQTPSRFPSAHAASDGAGGPTQRLQPPAGTEGAALGLTRMAADATLGRDGLDLDGYPGYRGVRVVGAWSWMEELGVGLAVEQEVAEAYSLLDTVRRLIWGAVLLSMLAILWLSASFGRGRRQIRETRNRLSAVVENAVDSIIIIDRMGRIDSINPATERMFGYTRAELVGQNVKRLMPAPFQGEHDGYLARYHLTGEARIMGAGREVLAQRKDGSIFPAELSVSRLMLVTGLHFAGTLRDISQRKAAEAALEEERQFNRQVLDTLSAQITVLDDQGTLVYVNEAWRRFGARCGQPDAEAAIGRNYLELCLSILPGDCEQAGTIHARLSAVQRGESNGFALEYPRPCAGKTLWFLMRATRFQREQERAMTVISHQDITSRREAEEYLRMMSLVAAKTDNGVILTDLEGRVKWLNPGFTNISGYTLDELLGRKPGTVLQGPLSDPVTIRAISEALRRRERIETEIINYHKEGHPYWLHLEIVPVRDDDGEVVEFIALELDVTKRRETEDKLRQAKELADSANKAKSSFLAMMSHEIRTPLNGIVGTIELLAHSLLDERQRDMLVTARDSSMTLMTIIDDLLDFSKIEAGRLELERVPISLESLVEGVAETLLPLAERKGIEVLLYCDPALPAVMGDPVRVRQILLNLLGNAIKFTGDVAQRPGRVEILAERAPDPAPPGQVGLRFVIRDNGIGMAPETLARLFQPFQQAETSTTRRFGGTGLGLVISQRLAGLMQGHIECESTAGEGSIFRVGLHLDPAPAAVPAPTVGVLAGLQVLLVQGDPKAMPILGDYLASAGARVLGVTAETAGQALSDQPGSEIVLVIDSPEDRAGADRLREQLRRQHPGREVRFLLIRRGRRRVIRPEAGDSLALDLNALRRRVLINAVAALAGRESPEIVQPASGLRVVETPVSVAEAEAAGRLILLVEDNETNQKVIREQLAVLGFAAELAENGREALERWRTGRYALVMTDCHMPEMDGYELSGHIRAEEGPDRHTPILAITADALKGTAARCIAAGMDAYLTKPMQLETLRAALDPWLPTDPDRLMEAVPLPAPVNGDAVDPETLAQVLGMSDPAVLSRFYADFLKSSAGHVADIRVAMDEGNLALLGKQAHKLKSSARTVGANALAELCQTLEAAAREGGLAIAAPVMPRFLAAYRAVETWVSEYLAPHSR